MREIIISQSIKGILPDLTLGCVECDVVISEDNGELWREIEATCGTIGHSGELAEVGSQPAIRASRVAYRLCGKDPARYRLSSEALMRRVVKGHQLYRINNVVDLLNLVSLKTGFSIGGYDADKISGSTIFDIGTKDEPYEAIGRGAMNIEFLPVFRDAISPFGSPTSDSVRTSVTSETTRFLMVIIGFSGEICTSEALDLSVSLLKKYAQADNIETVIIK
ncbi:MAG TPA: phenylalanine--tRNA ligase beta subunit-related protein [Prolixibacteraceae bacterium]|nr:phenylalanine--tRNA ligase beta subunit-related protein [Prolixibacteraceae bacterium]